MLEAWVPLPWAGPCATSVAALGSGRRVAEIDLLNTKFLRIQLRSIGNGCLEQPELRHGSRIAARRTFRGGDTRPVANGLAGTRQTSLGYHSG